MTTTDVEVESPPRGVGPIAWRRVLVSWLALPLSALAALLIGALLIIAFGANPLTGYHALVSGAFGGSYALASTAQKAVPLLLVAVGICIAVRASVWNIGGEGQIVVGAPGRHGHCLGPAQPACFFAYPSRSGRGRRRRCLLGRDRRFLQGLLQRQRDPEHDHAQPGGRAGDELPAVRADDQQVAVVCRHGFDTPDEAAVRALLAADHRERDAVEPRGGHSRGRRHRRVLAPVAHRVRLPHPRCRACRARPPHTPACPSNARS